MHRQWGLICLNFKNFSLQLESSSGSGFRHGEAEFLILGDGASNTMQLRLQLSLHLRFANLLICRNEQFYWSVRKQENSVCVLIKIGKELEQNCYESDSVAEATSRQAKAVCWTLSLRVIGFVAASYCAKMLKWIGMSPSQQSRYENTRKRKAQCFDQLAKVNSTWNGSRNRWWKKIRRKLTLANRRPWNCVRSVDNFFTLNRSPESQRDFCL
jgi:hypothetical protein